MHRVLSRELGSSCSATPASDDDVSGDFSEEGEWEGEWMQPEDQHMHYGRMHTYMVRMLHELLSTPVSGF